jgi:methionyl-tRNA formyltransferase
VIRVAYFGLPLGALLLAADGTPPVLVVLSPTEAPGRRRLRRRSNAPIVDLRDVPPGEATDAIARAVHAASFDLVVSWYFTRRIERPWLDRAPLGGIGAHPSLLPRYRGPNPFFAAIDAGDAVTGVTVHRLVEAYDAGDVLFAEPLAVGDRDSWQLARALDRPSLRLLRSAVRRISAGEALAATPQSEAFATDAPEPRGDALRVDFRWTTERVLRRVRALSPVPGVALSIRGVELFVTRARATEAYPRALAPGEAHAGHDGVVIRTGDAAVLVERASVVEPDTGDAAPLDAQALGALVSARRTTEPR